MFLKINDKGLIFNLGGMQYRTPMLMNISKQDVSKIIMALHLAGIKDFTITGSDGLDPVKKSVQGGKPAPVHHDPQSNDDVHLLINTIEERFKNFEKNLMKKLENNNTTSQEQISNLKREMFMNQFYDQDTSKKTFKKDTDETEAFFIPDINMDMKLKGSSTETLSNKEDVNEAVDALASLLKK